MYCVNGHAPFFKTIQEARMNALVSKDQWIGELRQDGLYEALADIYDDKKELIGTVLRPPQEWRDVESGHGERPEGIYYLKNGTTKIQFINQEDGSLAPEIVSLDFNADNLRFIVPSPEGNIPFTSANDARAFLYKIFGSPYAVKDSGTPILSSKGKVLGFVVRFSEDTVIYGNGKRWHEVRPNGRLGKAVRVKYAMSSDRASFPVDWKGPAFIENRPKETM